MGDWNPPRGAAHWLARGDMTKMTWGYEPGRIFLGALPEDPSVAVGRPDDRHIVTLAGTRTGKSSTMLLPNLKLWPGSVLAIDPKGELARTSMEWRRRFGRVVVLDPFAATSLGHGSGWNPFAELAALPASLTPDEAASLADAMLIEDAGRDGHWIQAARNLAEGLILYLVNLAGPEATLTDLRRIIASGEAMIPILERMANSDAFDGLVARRAASLLATNERERTSIISTLATQTAFLDSPGLQSVSADSSFRLTDFAADTPLSVFLVLPSGRMPTHFRWLRLFINMGMTAMERAQRPPKVPVLWMLEEFAQLGQMRALQAAAGYMAGYGVKLWMVLQDLCQLKAHYREGWETFLGNAGVVQAFGNSDPTTLEYLSRRLGEIDVEIVDQSPASSDSMRRGDFGQRYRQERRPLLSPNEIERLFTREASNSLILAAGQKPFVVNRVHWERI